jgi:hypothetical protein
MWALRISFVRACREKVAYGETTIRNVSETDQVNRTEQKQKRAEQNRNRAEQNRAKQNRACAETPPRSVE